MPSRTRTQVRRTTALALAVATTLALGACSDDEGSGDGEGDQDPAAVLEQAKQTFDDTEGVQISLSTDELPDGVTGLLSADGVGTHAPAFEGTIKVSYAGMEPQVPVVAVDGKVYAQLPLVPGWDDIDPQEYGAPDPATLMSPEDGFTSLLPATDDLEQGEQVRGGADNREVLTEYTGTVAGDTVKNVIPTASGDFDVVYTVADGEELREVVLTGVFYPDSEEMTYTIGFDDYGTAQEITAP
ncbi:LppX_LprAFG lipoprotein [Nocardioides pantholopis]|uniref:LppX_LprAFG lipoprotein n=1 Tax=Nocardioides pantholopis TaxID=2483798 RepID=UPI000F08FBEE|nr:LppX_LprAFG lipoprotein [Nocardioides pantholopis]